MYTNGLMIQSHVTKVDSTPVKAAAEAKFLVYLSPLSISFRMPYDTMESKKTFDAILIDVMYTI